MTPEGEKPRVQIQAEIQGKWRQYKVSDPHLDVQDHPLFDPKKFRMMRVLNLETGIVGYISLHDLDESVHPSDWPHENQKTERSQIQEDVGRSLDSQAKDRSVTHRGVDVNELYRSRGGDPTFHLDKSGGRGFHETGYRAEKKRNLTPIWKKGK